jgi:hypothetical protein
MIMTLMPRACVLFFGGSLGEYSNPVPFYGQRVLLVGGGETAADLAVEISCTAKGGRGPGRANGRLLGVGGLETGAG